MNPGLYEVKAMNVRDGKQHTLLLHADDVEDAIRRIQQFRFGRYVLYPKIDEVRLLYKVSNS